jgi:NADPH2:quinone reductase
MTTTMKAWLCETLTGVDGLQWREDLPLPQPKAGEVRVAVQAASLNFPDLLVVQGKYQAKPPLPFVPGAEFSGRIDALGDGVSGLKVGDPVAAIGVAGGFGSHACVDARNLIPLPPGFDLDDAAAFAFTYGTAHHALIDRAALQPGETVLVLGAAGGVGTAAVQVAKAAGARVIAAASSDEKCALLRTMGADATINYTRENLRDALKAGGTAPDVVCDPVGDALAEPAFRAIAWRGRYLVVGFAGGAIPALPWNLALLKGASVVGVFWGDFVRREPQASARALQELAAWYAQGKIKPVIEAKLPMRELRDAYARMASRQVRGKLLLVND